MKKPIIKNGNVLQGDFIPKSKSDDLHLILDDLRIDFNEKAKIRKEEDRARQQKYQEEMHLINEKLLKAKKDFVDAEIKYQKRIKIINNIRTGGYLLCLGAVIVGTVISLTK